VVYPDAGQFSGREAYLRGFVLPRDNGSGPPQVRVAGELATLRDGAFEAFVDKDTLGFFADRDDAAWSVDVVATYPDRQELRRTVRLDHQTGTPASIEGRLLAPRQFHVAPGQARQLLYDESRLELGANALRSETTITMSALDDAKLAALDQGMTNVTKGPRRGYRFLPHGHRFAESVRVSMPYDPARIPEGLTEQDIYTFYFDDQRGAWVALDRVSVDASSRTVVSLTDHFTDMINATLTAPDHPQAEWLSPTSLKDVAAADPAQGVNLIAAPEPNESGEARLSYNLELPPGRREMQPSLAISYGSSASSGWLGLGWDLTAPAVTTETRWGVPRYDAALETESYMLEGAPLAPVSHRAAPVARTAEKVFHMRTEGEFKEIVRHGSAPANFWWEVKDKLGVRSFYGGSPSSGGADPAATLTDAQGNVFKWFLKERRDLDGNAGRLRLPEGHGPGNRRRNGARLSALPSVDQLHGLERRAGTVHRHVHPRRAAARIRPQAGRLDRRARRIQDGDVPAVEARRGRLQRRDRPCLRPAIPHGRVPEDPAHFHHPAW
jgi:hypothetical protein